MNNLLVLSPFPLNKDLKHAGGKIHYHYISKLFDNYNLTHVSVADYTQEKELNSSTKKYQENIMYFKLTKFSSFMKKFWQLNPLDKYSGFIDYRLHKHIIITCKNLKKNGYTPEIIILDFTQTILLLKKIKKIFPNSKYISVEQDVTFLKYFRFYTNSKNYIKKIINLYKYHNIKNKELSNLKYSNEILVLNEKDKELLIKNKIDKKIIRTIVPYFEIYSSFDRKKVNNNKIIYYGAMSRPENYNSVIWFIENIFNHLPENFVFYIIGNNPDNSLYKYKSNRIIITGFVNSLKPYFEDCLCLVAPITSGAGIKIKILEALSAGIPVLTNHMGIEGIPAINNKDYLLCETPEDFISYILKLSKNRTLANEIGQSAKSFILSNYNYWNESYIK